MNQFDKEWKSFDLYHSLQRPYTYHLLNLKYAYAWYDIRNYIKVDGAPDIPEMWSTNSNETFRTKARRPDEPPLTDIGGFHVNDNGHIYIYWKSLPLYKNNGANFHYNITIVNSDFSHHKPYEITNTMAKYEQLPIKYQNDFIFNVYSVNEIGRSIDSSNVRVPTINKRCQSPIHLKKIRHDGLYNLSWTPPNDNNVVGYTVFWCKPKDELSNQCDVSFCATL